MPWAQRVLLPRDFFLNMHVEKKSHVNMEHLFLMHMRCLLRRANLPRRFWPYAMLHFCRVYAYWPDTQGKSAWDKLDAHGPHALCHDEARDLHRFGSYVTGHLPRTHPLVEGE